MTRINLVHPCQLTNKHLLAEYRELPRVITLINKHLSKHGSFNSIDIPATYTLGKGHVKFFYNKPAYLQARYSSIVTELIIRKFNVDDAIYESVERSINTLFYKYTKHNIFVSYTPTPEEVYLNMSRLVIRSKIPACYDEIITFASGN